MPVAARRLAQAAPAPGVPREPLLRPGAAPPGLIETSCPISPVDLGARPKRAHVAAATLPRAGGLRADARSCPATRPGRSGRSGPGVPREPLLRRGAAQPRLYRDVLPDQPRRPRRPA